MNEGAVFIWEAEGFDWKVFEDRVKEEHPEIIDALELSYNEDGELNGWNSFRIDYEAGAVEMLTKAYPETLITITAFIETWYEYGLGYKDYILNGKWYRTHLEIHKPMFKKDKMVSFDKRDTSTYQVEM